MAVSRPGGSAQLASAVRAAGHRLRIPLVARPAGKCVCTQLWMFCFRFHTCSSNDKAAGRFVQLPLVQRHAGGDIQQFFLHEFGMQHQPQPRAIRMLKCLDSHASGIQLGMPSYHKDKS